MIIKQRKNQTKYFLKVENEKKKLSVGWLVGFYGMSTIVVYLMPNLFFY